MAPAAHQPSNTSMASRGRGERAPGGLGPMGKAGQGPHCLKYWEPQPLCRQVPLQSDRPGWCPREGYLPPVLWDPGLPSLQGSLICLRMDTWPISNLTIMKGRQTAISTSQIQKPKSKKVYDLDKTERVIPTVPFIVQLLCIRTWHNFF